MEQYIPINIRNNQSSIKRRCTQGCNIIFFLIFIVLQIILIVYQIKNNDYMKKDEYKFWDKNLISEINVLKKGYLKEKFDDSDSSKPIQIYYKEKVYLWNDYSFYAYRRSEEYNYIKLRTLNNEEKNINTKICGKDYYGHDLYYPIYEKCPINFIEISDDSTPSIPSEYDVKTIQMDNKYLHYSNNYYQGYPFYGLEISEHKISCSVSSQRFPSLNLEDCVDEEVIPYDKTLIDIEDEKTLKEDNQLGNGDSNKFVKLFPVVYAQNYTEISDSDTKKKLKVFKYYLSYSNLLYVGIFAGFFFLILIFIVFFCYCCKKIRHGKLGIISFYLYLFYMISYIPLFIVKLNVDYKTRYKFIHYLHFIILFLPLIILIFNLCNVRTKRCKNFWKAFVVFLLLIYLIFNIIINGKQFFNGKLDKGRFEDFYNTFTKSPIIDIKKTSNEKYNLGKIVYSDDINSKPKETKLYTWENVKFEITRLSDDYTYGYMLKNNDNGKKCGVDLVGNPLYLPHDVICPINYIEISNNESPPDENKSFNKIKLGSNKYLYYSNEYIDNQILFDFKISDKIPPYTSTNSYNALCYSIYIHGYKYCNFGKNYYDYEGKSGYSLIDIELLSTLASNNNLPDTSNIMDKLNNDYAFLYKRTYSGVEINKTIKKAKINDFNFISKIINVAYIIFLIIFTLFFIIGIYKSTKFVLCISLLSIICCLFLELYIVLSYLNIKSNFFSISFLDLAKMNKDYPLYYKLDFSFVIINGILILINIIFLCCNKNVEGFEINEEEEIESESDEEQIKINDLEIQNANLEKERETIRNEIDNNKKLIIQQQNDLEEKTKWEERQKKENEKIQLDLNNQVRNLRLSLESKNRELERKDFDLQSQHEKTLELKNQLRDTISEYNAQIKGLESDKNKLQDEKENLLKEKEKIIDERIKLQEDIQKLKENTGGNNEENQNKIKEYQKQINELNRNYSIVTSKLKEQKNKLDEKDKELEIIKEEKEKVENERDEIAKEKEEMQKLYQTTLDDKNKIMEEIEELRKNNTGNTIQDDERLKQLEKQQKELNKRIIVLQELVKKNIDPKISLPLTLNNIIDCIENGDYFGRTKEEIMNKIQEIKDWLSFNENTATEKEYRDKLNELKFFLHEEKNR